MWIAAGMVRNEIVVNFSLYLNVLLPTGCFGMREKTVDQMEIKNSFGNTPPKLIRIDLNRHNANA